jgi:M6 family metalloprotease-like protein
MAAIAMVSTTACGGGSHDPSAMTPVIERLLADRPAPSTDQVEVWICRVPTDTTAAIYGRLPLRLDLDPATVAAQLAAPVGDYFRDISAGRYSVSMAAGGVIELGVDETDADCVARAVRQASTDASVVLAVANAEHVAGEPGGHGTSGTWPTCVDACNVAHTGRVAYVGASDFSPDWGPVPLLDLIEHELGHTLGLPHSGLGGPRGVDYLSALDLMSNSASPRDVNPSTLDGPDLIAIDRVDLGWLPLADTVLGATGTVTVTLAPSTGPSGTRVLVLPVDEHRVVTVELLTPTGYNAHLPEAGIAVHLVDDSTGTGIDRTQQPLVGEPPFTDLLGAGERITVHGWTITVTALDVAAGSATAAEVAARRTDG